MWTFFSPLLFTLALNLNKKKNKSCKYTNFKIPFDLTVSFCFIDTKKSTFH